MLGLGSMHMHRNFSCMLFAGLVAANPGLGKLLFALLFPVGLTMNTLHGTELFTGNTMKLPAAIYEGKTNMAGLMKNWFWSYLGASSVAKCCCMPLLFFGMQWGMLHEGFCICNLLRNPAVMRSTVIRQ